MRAEICFKRCTRLGYVLRPFDSEMGPKRVGLYSPKARSRIRAEPDGQRSTSINKGSEGDRFTCGCTKP